MSTIPLLRLTGARVTSQPKAREGPAVFGLGALALCFVLGTPREGLGQDASPTLAIVGGYLIDGNGGPPVRNSVILVAGERIVHVGTAANTEVPRGVRTIDARGHTVMPGLHDAHVHLIGAGHGNYSEYFPRYVKRFREIALVSARQLLSAGVTSARDLGMPLEDAAWVKKEVESGRAPGPRLFVSGPFLQKSFDPFWGDIRWRVDGAEDARRKTRRLIDAGMDVIKVIEVAALTPEERLAIADEAHRARKHIVVHAGSVEELQAAVEMRVGSVEHVGGGRQPLHDDEYVRLLVQSGTWYVPTSIVQKIYQITESFPARLENPRLERDLPADLFADIRQSLEHPSRLGYFANRFWTRHHQSKIMQVHKAGGRILVGTDAGTPMNFHYEVTWQEMDLLAGYGIDAMHVIQAATKYPPMLYGLGNELGTIEPGRFADIIIVDGNPLVHMSALKNVIHVVKGGTLVVEDRRLLAPTR